LNIINVAHLAEQRGIKLKTSVIEDERSANEAKLVMTVEGGGQTRRIVGRVFDDLRPRVVDINGYYLDMIPAGHMVMLQNEDRPGMIGLVGSMFGQSSVNISDMAISRRQGDDSAFMVFKVDSPPPSDLIDNLRKQPGILKVAIVKLPDEPK
jgi:D-3-phosphoglycerate dehydrogenase